MSKSELRTFSKFVVKLAALVVAAHTLLIAANWIAADRLMPYLYQLARLHREFIENRVGNLKGVNFLIIGDSTASRGIIPENLSPFDSFSIAVPGGSAVEAYYSLKRAYENGAKPRCIVLMTSYAAYERHQRESFWQATVPNRSLKAEEVEDFYRETRKIGIEPGKSTLPAWGYVKALVAQILIYADWSKLNEAVFKPYVSQQHPRRSYRSFRYSKGATPSALSAIWIPEPFDGAYQQFLKYEFKPLPVIDLYLKKIFEMATDHHSHVLIVMMPIGHPLRTPIAEAWVENYRKHMKELGNSYPMVRNEMQPEWWPKHEFLDGTHLDDVGAAKFSDKIQPLVRSCGQQQLDRESR